MKAKNKFKSLRYSIRKCSDDEIEIRNSMLDGYIRGFIRLLFIGFYCVSAYFYSQHGKYAFYSEIRTIKEDLTWAFNPDAIIKPIFDEENDPKNAKFYPNAKNVSYQEYKAWFLNRKKYRIIRAYSYFLFFPLLIVAFCLPRSRGIRINRKKRVIYARLTSTNYAVAPVPKQGDPLAGLNWTLYGEYPFSDGKHFALRFMMKNEQTQLGTYHLLGVYPTPNVEHNAEIVRAIRAYLTEENPEFLQYIGTRFKVLWNLKIAFCNALALPLPFNRKNADKAIEQALKKWNRNTLDKKAIILKRIKENQDRINAEVIEHGFSNDV